LPTDKFWRGAPYGVDIVNGKRNQKLTVCVSNTLTSIRTDRIESRPRVLTTDVTGRSTGWHGNDAALMTSSITTYYTLRLGVTSSHQQQQVLRETANARLTPRRSAVAGGDRLFPARHLPPDNSLCGRFSALFCRYSTLPPCSKFVVCRQQSRTLNV